MNPHSVGRTWRAEWTKLRSVPTLMRCLLGAAGAVVAVALLISSGSPGVYDRASYVDEFRFVHRTVTDGFVLTARVGGQEAGHPWTMAGLIIKDGLTPGAPYAALFVTPGHGVRLQANFSLDLPGGSHTSPRWLRLQREGETVTGYESGDGTTWTEVGAVRLTGLPSTVEAGMFVTSPSLTRQAPMRPALVQTRPATATFDEVAIDADAGSWQAHDVGRDVGGQAVGPDAAGVFTITGSGDIIGQFDDGSRVTAATAGTVFALLPIVAFGALGMTSEYRWRTIWYTLAANPRRGRVYAAKAAVVGIAAFVAGLVATVVALFASQPLLRSQGYRPPVYADPSLADPTVIRVVVGSGLAFALLALLGLGLGAAVRRGAGAVTLIATALFVPLVLTPFLPNPDGFWLQRLSPLAGLSVHQVRETDDALLLPWAGRPWAGVAVLAGYTFLALLAGYWRLRRPDAVQNY